jgi:hypothetical protein
MNITNLESAVKEGDLSHTFRFFFKSYLQFFERCSKLFFDFIGEKA